MRKGANLDIPSVLEFILARQQNIQQLTDI